MIVADDENGIRYNQLSTVDKPDVPLVPNAAGFGRTTPSFQTMGNDQILINLSIPAL
jgi:hypothetical protein